MKSSFFVKMRENKKQNIVCIDKIVQKIYILFRKHKMSDKNIK